MPQLVSRKTIAVAEALHVNSWFTEVFSFVGKQSSHGLVTFEQGDRLRDAFEIGKTQSLPLKKCWNPGRTSV